MERINYFDVDYLSNSDMSYLLKSTRHYIDYKADKQKPTSEMELGSAIHKYILEKDDFVNEYVICDLDKRTKDYKEFEKTNTKKIINTSDMELLLNIEKEILLTDYTKNLIYDDMNIFEHEVYFDFKGVKCKSKLDILNLEKRLIIDLKTTNNIDDISKTINNYHYYRQSRFYQIAIQEKYDIECDFIFIFISKDKSIGIKSCELFGYENRADEEIDLSINRYKEYLNNPDKHYFVCEDKLETIFKPSWL